MEEVGVRKPLKSEDQLLRTSILSQEVVQLLAADFYIEVSPWKR
jgi:hypothetical protein